MTRAEKQATVEQLKEKFSNSQFFYLTDSSTLNVEQINAFRRVCFEKDIEVKVVKNTLAIKAMESIEDKSFDDLFEAMKGPTTILFTEKANEPAKVLKEFRKKNPKPILKAAYIDSDIFIGDEQIDTLGSLKSKEDLLGEIIILLQSPIKNVVGSLQSGGNTISGLLKALESREE